jgi:hypothetical protein
MSAGKRNLLHFPSRIDALHPPFLPVILKDACALALAMQLDARLETYICSA